MYGSTAIPLPMTTTQPAETPVKTTIVLPADLWKAARLRAVEERTNLRAMMIAALRAYLGHSAPKRREEVR